MAVLRWWPKTKQFGEHRDLIYQCDGGDNHYLRLSFWEDEDSFIWVEETYHGGLWFRLKHWAKFLRTGYIQEIVLSPEDLKNMYMELGNSINKDAVIIKEDEYVNE